MLAGYCLLPVTSVRSMKVCGLPYDQKYPFNWAQVTALFIASTMLVKLPFFIHYMIVHRNYSPEKRDCEDGTKEVIKIWTVVAMTMFLALAAYLGWLDTAHDEDFQHDTVSQVGLALGALALLGTIWTHITLGTSWSGIVTVQKNHALKVTGLYRLCRHPMYATMILMCIAVGMMSQNWLITAIYALLHGVIIGNRISKEERLMIELFGQQYVEYKQRVGAFWPWKMIHVQLPIHYWDFGLSDAEVEEVMKKRGEAEVDLKDKKQ